MDTKHIYYSVRIFSRTLKTTPYIFWFGLLLITLSGIYFFNALTRENHRLNSKTALENIRSKSGTDVFAGIRDRLPEIIAAGGIAGAFDLSHEALVQGDIGMLHCHMLVHLIGHTSGARFAGNADAIMKQGSDVCELGYRHGAEAEIARESGPNFREELYRFCEELQRTSPGASCYHGAGHAFMSETHDVRKALDLCDSLTGGPVSDVSDCYKGLFAEYTNLIGGVDGETGLPYDNSQMLHQEETPIAYCASFAKKYQIPCVREVCGYRAPGDIEWALDNAIAGNYPQEMRAACVQSAAAVKAQHELGSAKTVSPPLLVFSLPVELQEAYITGTAWEFSEYIKDGAERDWQSFCRRFDAEKTRTFCTKFFGAR